MAMLTLVQLKPKSLAHKFLTKLTKLNKVSKFKAGQKMKQKEQVKK
jgi:hypothetical protein